MRSVIYLDNNATTPVDPRVLDAMLPYFNATFGNAASRSHQFGWQAKDAVDEARESIASIINASTKDEIIFTSGATESVNLAIKGFSCIPSNNHIITTQIEHKAVLDSCKRLEKLGWEITYLPVLSDGLVDLNVLSKTISSRTCLVSIMTANNEIGVLQDIETIGKMCRQKGVFFHTDATQAVGKVPFDVQKMNIDLASFTAHKIYGPKGVGALYINKQRIGKEMTAQIDGGGHEGGFRSGTLNVPSIVGLAKALEICTTEMHTESERITFLRNKLHYSIINQLSFVYLNGHPAQCLPGTLNLSFDYIDADSLQLAMPEIAVSPGSACTSAQTTPSHVLKALGISDELAQASLRFSIGRFNTEEEITYTASRCIKEVSQLRAMSPLYRRAILRQAA